MSSEYMRQIMESVSRAQTLNEGYEDRVNDVVALLNSYYPNGMNKKQFQTSIDKAGQESGAVELRKNTVAGRNRGNTGNSRNEFIKDVAARIDFRRDTSTADGKRERTDRALLELSRIIETAVGDAFPDGDPFDHIAPKARKLGIPLDNLIAWLDRAAKTHLGAKNYHDYLDQVWDDYSTGNLGMDPGNDYM